MTEEGDVGEVYVYTSKHNQITTYTGPECPV